MTIGGWRFANLVAATVLASCGGETGSDRATTAGAGGSANGGSSGTIAGSGGADAGSGGTISGSGGTAGEAPCAGEYDLPFYLGSTEGLCPAAEVKQCNCGDRGAAAIAVCVPDGSACSVQYSVCAGKDGPDCGWIECPWPSENPEADPFCAARRVQIEEAEQYPWLHQRCVTDADCMPMLHCVRRVHNVMHCAIVEE